MTDLETDIEFYLTRISFYDRQIGRFDLELNPANSKNFADGFGAIVFSLTLEECEWFRSFWKQGLIEFMSRAIRKQAKESKDKKVEKNYQ